MGGVAPHTCFIQSADTTVEQASQPITCDMGQIKAMKGEIKRRRILSKGISLHFRWNWPCFRRERENVLLRWRRSIRQSIITKKILKLDLLWYLVQSILLFAGDIRAVYGALHKWIFWKSLSGTVWVYLLLSFLRKLSGNPPSRWVITQAGRSDFMAADWKMALCSTSIYIGKCWWLAITNAIVDGTGLPVVSPWHLIVVHVQLCIMH